MENEIEHTKTVKYCKDCKYWFHASVKCDCELCPGMDNSETINNTSLEVGDGR